MESKWKGVKEAEQFYTRSIDHVSSHCIQRDDCFALQQTVLILNRHFVCLDLANLCCHLNCNSLLSNINMVNLSVYLTLCIFI